MPDFIKQTDPVRIKVPGDKIIEEHFGKVATEHDHFSVAHMKAPAGWSEPPQTPEFDEVTIMIKGRMQIQSGDEIVELDPGETFLAPRGTTVQYANPFEEDNEYWSLCVPAFSPDTVNRKA